MYMYVSTTVTLHPLVLWVSSKSCQPLFSIWIGQFDGCFGLVWWGVLMQGQTSSVCCPRPGLQYRSQQHLPLIRCSCKETSYHSMFSDLVSVCRICCEKFNKAGEYLEKEACFDMLPQGPWISSWWIDTTCMGKWKVKSGGFADKYLSGTDTVGPREKDTMVKDYGYYLR